MTNMIVTTTGSVPGNEIGEALGVVKGNTVRARNIGRDIEKRGRGRSKDIYGYDHKRTRRGV